jgi:hypothetical protein
MSASLGGAKLAAIGAAATAAARVNRLVRISSIRDFSKISGKAFLFVAIALMLWVSCCRAGEPLYSPAPGLLTWFGWHEPDDLPPRFRNNCGIHNGRFYCAHRCGSTYQFYYCSSASFGCCHIGDGYCDYRGLLSCRP